MDENMRIEVLESALLDLLDDLSCTRSGLEETQQRLSQSETRLATTEAKLHDARIRLERAEASMTNAATGTALQAVRREIFESKSDVLRWFAGSLAVVFIVGVLVFCSTGSSVSTSPQAMQPPIIIRLY